MRRIYNNKDGRFYYVNDDGSPSINTPVNPGIGIRREKSIFSRLPDAELAGFRGPGVVPEGMAQSENHYDGRPLPMPTYRPMAGNQENNRGNQVIFDPAELFTTNDVLATGAWKLIAQNEKNAGEDAESICVSLGRIVVNAVKPGAGDAAIMQKQYQCLLEWGIGGANFSCILDWDHGRILSVPASFIRVSARQLLLSTALAPLYPSTEALATGFAYGIPSHPNGARLTFPIGPREGANDGTSVGGLLPPGGLTSLGNVPDFATHMGLYVTTAPPSAAPLNVAVTFYKSNAAPFTTTAIYSNLTNLQSEKLLPIPNGTEYITVENLNAVGVYVDGFWGLSL